MRKQLELLAPAGNFEKLKFAVAYGADAVYFSGKTFGLRAFSDNFTAEEMVEAVRYLHRHQRAAYVTMNIVPHNEDLAAVESYLKFLQEAEVDAVIVSDPGLFRLVRRYAPELTIHVSTQANITNWSAAQFWCELGAKRLVLARELSLGEISTIRQAVPEAELECFVHGAMCISYSGRCLMSNYLTARDANRGECAQPCRWRYALVEEKRPGQFFPVLEDDRGTYVFNSKDLCMLPHLPDLLAAGVDSCKIEGRMKSVHYVATVIRTYRQAIDSCLEDPAGYTVRPEWLAELGKVSHRPYTTGFYYGNPTEEDQIYGRNSYLHDSAFVGVVQEYAADKGMALVEQRNHIRVGDVLEIVRPDQLSNGQVQVTALFDEAGEPIVAAPHPQQKFWLPVAEELPPFTILRRLEGTADA